MEKLDYGNTAVGKSLNFKHRTLAMFQFFSFAGIITLMMSLILVGYTIIQTEKDGNIFNLSPWLSHFGNSLIFSKTEVTGIFAGLLFYIFIGL